MLKPVVTKHNVEIYCWISCAFIPVKLHLVLELLKIHSKTARHELWVNRNLP